MHDNFDVLEMMRQYTIEYIRPIIKTVNRLPIPNTIIYAIFEDYLSDDDTTSRYYLQYDNRTDRIRVTRNYQWLNRVNLYKYDNPPRYVYISICGIENNINKAYKHYQSYQYYKLNKNVHYFVTDENYSREHKRDFPPNCLYFYNGATFNGHIKPIPLDFIYNGQFDYDDYFDTYCDFKEKYSTGKMIHYNGDLDSADDEVEQQHAYYTNHRETIQLDPHYIMDTADGYTSPLHDIMVFSEIPKLR